MTGRLFDHRLDFVDFGGVPEGDLVPLVPLSSVFDSVISGLVFPIANPYIMMIVTSSYEIMLCAHGWYVRIVMMGDVELVGIEYVSWQFGVGDVADGDVWVWVINPLQIFNPSWIELLRVVVGIGVDSPCCCWYGGCNDGFKIPPPTYVSGAGVLVPNCH